MARWSRFSTNLTTTKACTPVMTNTVSTLDEIKHDPYVLTSILSALA